ncbi:MAG: M48 family metalloprotease [Maricaulaceae bacterium]
MTLTAACLPTNSEQTQDISIQETASSSQAGSDQHARQNDASTPLNNREFRDVLNEFMGLNERLDRIASRIKIANADLCETTENDIGISTHTINDYPDELRSAARHYLRVDENLSVRTVRIKSAAHKAGIRAGDRIIKINETSLIDNPLFTETDLAGALAKAAFHLALDNLALTQSAQIEYQRGSQTYNAELSLTKKCKIPVTLFFSEDINGHLLDGEIWMTSALLRNIQDDVRVAYIMAHEMAHALRHHADIYTPDIELEADRDGLIILARAAYNPEDLAAFWAEQIDLLDGGETQSSSHPDLITRKDNYISTLSSIKQTGLDNEKLKDLFFK